MAVGPYGYILEYHLSPNHYPGKGTNQVGVTLVTRDPRISGPVDVVDVDCHIEYRHHRNFEDSPIPVLIGRLDFRAQLHRKRTGSMIASNPESSIIS